MRFCYQLFILSLFVVTTGSAQEDLVQNEEPGWKSIQIPFDYKNIQVPSALWDSIKTVLRKDGVKESLIETFSVAPISLQVEIQSQEKLVLRDSMNFRILYIEGGGKLDLFDYVTGKGPFNVRFAPHLTDGYDYHLMYISDSPGKQVNGQAWGNGCGKIYDLSAVAEQFVEAEGMRLTSSRRNYMHLMAGTFVFFQLVEERLFLGYIRFTDSRYPNFTCRNS